MRSVEPERLDEARIKPRRPIRDRPRVIIIGGGFGGLQAARGLRHAPVEVTLVDRNNHHAFQPLLYQVATAALETQDVAFPLRSLLRRQKNAEVVMAEARSIDPIARYVRFASGRTLGYEFLIFAAGAESSYFGHPEFRDFAPSLKSVRDALEVRYRVLMAFERAEQEPDPARVRDLMTFIIVGGGPTGVELAGAVAELARHALKRDFRHIDPTHARVVLIENGPHVLATYPPELQLKAERQLASLGVDVRTSTAVHTVDAAGVLVGNDRIGARTVLWGAGVSGTPLARTLGVPLDRHGRIEVDPNLHPPGLANVFVIGDAATLTQDGQPVPGVAPAAIQGGRYAAHSINKLMRGEPIAPFHYWNKGQVSTIGRSRAVAMLPGGVHLSGLIAWLAYLSIHLFYLSGFRTRFLVFCSWIWSYLTWDRGARLIPSASQAARVYQAEHLPEPEHGELEPPAPQRPHDETPAPQTH